MSRANLNRSCVVAAALEILETAGSSALTIPALAMKLKIRPPSLYNHIESISDLKRELSIHSMRLVCEELRKAAEGKSRDEAVLAAANGYRRFASEHPALYALSISIPPVNDREWFEAISETLKYWMQALGGYELEMLQARHVTRALRSMVHGFVDIEVNGGWFEDIDMEQSFAATMNMLLTSIHAEEARNK